MSFETIEEEHKVNSDLSLIGWYADQRVTSEDATILKEIGRRVRKLHDSGGLSHEMIVELSWEAFACVGPNLLDPGERAVAVGENYSRSQLLGDNLVLIDEALLSYYRGYHTAALALLFVALEAYLRRALGWAPGRGRPTFAQLKVAVRLLPDCEARNRADGIIQTIYDDYRADSPPALLFNRHGLLHGMRGASGLDRMNFARLLALFDLLVAAELGEFDRGTVWGPAVRTRYDAYSACVFFGREKILLGNR